MHNQRLLFANAAAHPPIAEIPLTPGSTPPPGGGGVHDVDEDPSAGEANAYAKPDEQPLTIAEAKRRLALSLGIRVETSKL
jgi:hypothetical protein